MKKRKRERDLQGSRENELNARFLDILKHIDKHTIYLITL